MPNDPDWTPLATVIVEAEASGAVVGAAVRGPDGERFAHNGGRRFVAASTVKIAILVELFRQVDAGTVALDTPHVMRAEDKTTGSGVLCHLHDGLAPTLSDLAFLMMSISDNTATNILIDRVGQERVNGTLRALGLTGSTLGRRMRGELASDAEAENWAVPEEYARLVSALLDGTAASAASCARMVALLELQQNDRRIARHLPRTGRPRWGSKTGSLPGVVNDVGFVDAPRGPVVLSVFCEAVEPHEGEALVGAIARAALEVLG